MAKSELIFYLSNILALIYFVTIKWHPFSYHWLIKGLSIFSLGVFSCFYLPSSFSYIFVISLFSSGIGDMFLAYDGKKFFIYGLVSFFVAHIFYLFYFLKNMSHFSSIESNKIILMSLLTFYSIFMFVVLYSKLGNLKIPVFFYISVLVFMSGSAVIASFSNIILISGVFLFVASDSLLAIQKFLKSVRGINYMIWLTYYLAQVFILFGVQYSK